jgi:hypothetical protein
MAQIFGLLFFNGESYVINFAKKWVGLHFGHFFTTSSAGHPVPMAF